MDPIGLIFTAIQLSIAAYTFGYGLFTSGNEWLYILRRPRLLVLSLLAMFVVMPVIALVLADTHRFLTTTNRTLVALALSPVALNMPAGQRGANARAYAIGLTVCIALLSVVFVPANVGFLGRLMGEPFGMKPSDVAIQVLTLVALPTIAGIVIRMLSSSVADRLCLPLQHIAKGLMTFASFGLFLLVLPGMWSVSTLWTILGCLAFASAGLAIGHVMGGPEQDHEVVLAISCTNRHPGIAFGILSANFPTQSFGVAIVLYLIVSTIMCKLYLKWQCGGT